MPSIKELESQLAAAKAEAEVDIRASAQALRASLIWVWKATWLTKFQVKITREPSAWSKEAHAAWKAQNPAHSHFLPDWDIHTGSMTYVLIGQHIASAGGGTVLLKTGDAPAPYKHDEPLKITNAEENELRAGRVPRSIRQEGYAKDNE